MHIKHAGLYLGHMYFILSDAHWKWIEAYIVNPTSWTTIKKLKEIFAIHRIPDQIVSDNGTGFYI